jgi:hypothetical protein
MKTITSTDFAHLINAFSGDVVAETLIEHKWLDLPSIILKEATCRAAENLIGVTLAHRNFYVVSGHDIYYINHVHGNGLVEIHDCGLVDGEHDSYVATYPLAEFQSRFSHVFMVDSNCVISIRKLLSYGRLKFNDRHAWESGDLVDLVRTADFNSGLEDGMWISVLFRIELPGSEPDERRYHFKMDYAAFSTVFPHASKSINMFDNDGAEFVKHFNSPDRPEIVIVSAKRLIIKSQITIEEYQEDAIPND